VGPLFRPWAKMILDEVQLSSGDPVLDIACGTGIMARVARERFGDAGSIVGIDVSPDRLAVARAVAPSIDWRAMPALYLFMTQSSSMLSSANKECSSLPTSPLRQRRCVERWLKVAGWRSPHGGATMKCRFFESFAVSQNVISALSWINGTASKKRLRLRRCFGTPASMKSG
jgi:SAM-dependent methyltransferase